MTAARSGRVDNVNAPRESGISGGRGTVGTSYGTRPSLDPLPPANISGVSIEQEESPK